MKSRIWEDYTLDEMLLHLVVCLDWQDGYDKYEEGSCIAKFHNYELEFNDEYSDFNVKRILPDGTLHMIYRFSVKMYRLIDSIIGARIRGTKFTFWDEKTLRDTVLAALDELDGVLLIITPEGKYFVKEEKNA